MSLRIDKRSAPRLRPELRTRYEIDIRERPLGTRYVRLRFLAKASTLAFDSVSSVGCVYTSLNSNEAVQISSTRQRKNVGDKSRFKRCMLFLAQTLQCLRQGLYRGNMNYNLRQKVLFKGVFKENEAYYALG